jgi:putative PIN family toxin of toxin-antitoxin system
MPNVVLDANTIVSAALVPNSMPDRALSAVREHDVICLSGPVIDEIERVLRRPKFAGSLKPERIDEVLALLTASARWFTPTQPVRDCRDVKDNKYLELALAADAETIVSGDNDLISLHPWRTINILTPADYVRMREQPQARLPEDFGR